ncbi:hypothetical protein J1605_001339 [Eschrichtius robustus]|uniref:Uncharacterized protein n=1 Tax=Eschrichtius robustus TaxID=9764 RepID=A0AB34G799_ESCRO|nr:hypothetical protein J1605_001339 [Eschrichtius robustus]
MHHSKRLAPPQARKRGDSGSRLPAASPQSSPEKPAEGAPSVPEPSRVPRNGAVAVGGASSQRPAAPRRRREAVAAAAGPERRGDWLRRAETSGSRGRSGGPARRGAAHPDAPLRSSPLPPPRPPLPLDVRTHTMTKKEKKSFNQSLAEWKLFIYNPTTGEFLGRTAKSWGERAAVGRRGRPQSGGRRAGSGGKGRREAAPRAGAPGAAAASARSGFRRGRQTRTRPHSFLAESAGGRARLRGPLAAAAGPRRFLPPCRERGARAARACGAGSRLPLSQTPSAWGPSARPPLYGARRPGEALAEAASGAELFGEARPCPTPGERKFPLPPLSCDSSTLPPQRVGRV